MKNLFLKLNTNQISLILCLIYFLTRLIFLQLDVISLPEGDGSARMTSIHHLLEADSLKTFLYYWFTEWWPQLQLSVFFVFYKIGLYDANLFASFSLFFSTVAIAYAMKSIEKAYSFKASLLFYLLIILQYSYNRNSASGLAEPWCIAFISAAIYYSIQHFSSNKKADLYKLSISILLASLCRTEAIICVALFYPHIQWRKIYLQIHYFLISGSYLIIKLFISSLWPSPRAYTSSLNSHGQQTGLESLKLLVTKYIPINYKKVFLQDFSTYSLILFLIFSFYFFTRTNKKEIKLSFLITWVFIGFNFFAITIGVVSVVDLRRFYMSNFLITMCLALIFMYIYEQLKSKYKVISICLLSALVIAQIGRFEFTKSHFFNPNYTLSDDLILIKNYLMKNASPTDSFAFDNFVYRELFFEAYLSKKSAYFPLQQINYSTAGKDFWNDFNTYFKIARELKFFKREGAEEYMFFMKQHFYNLATTTNFKWIVVSSDSFYSEHIKKHPFMYKSSIRNYLNINSFDTITITPFDKKMPEIKIKLQKIIETDDATLYKVAVIN